MSVQESALPRQGIEGLYAEHHGWLRGWLRGRLGNAFDAADLAHDTYLRILSSGRMRAAAIAPAPGADRQGLVIDLYRRRQIEAAYLDALARLPQPLAPSAEDCAAAVQALVDIDAVLNGLPPKAREALLLRKLDGMSYRDIATRLRVSVSSVESTWRPPCWPAARPGWRCPATSPPCHPPHRSRHRPARPNGWPACGRTTPASRTAPTARAGGRSIPITNGPGRPCWRSRTSWRACSRRRAVMPCGAPYPARDGAAPCACWGWARCWRAPATPCVAPTPGVAPPPTTTAAPGKSAR